MNFGELLSAANATSVLVGALAYALGAFMIASALMRVRRISQVASMGTSHSGDGTTVTVIATLVGGTCLIYFPSTITTIGSTLFGTNPLAYGQTSTGTGGSWEYANILIRWVEVIGLISIVRGLWMMKDLGERGQHGQSVGGKIVVHILAGAMAYYISEISTVLSGIVNIDFLKALGVGA